MLSDVLLYVKMSAPDHRCREKSLHRIRDTDLVTVSDTNNVPETDTRSDDDIDLHPLISNIHSRINPKPISPLLYFNLRSDV